MVTPQDHSSKSCRPQSLGKPHDYGMTQEQLDKLLVFQGYKCPICQLELDPGVIDHDHVTGRVRGILHRGCNLKVAGYEYRMGLTPTYGVHPDPIDWMTGDKPGNRPGDATLALYLQLPPAKQAGIIAVRSATPNNPHKERWWVESNETPEQIVGHLTAWDRISYSYQTPDGANVYGINITSGMLKRHGRISRGEAINLTKYDPPLRNPALSQFPLLNEEE